MSLDLWAAPGPKCSQLNPKFWLSRRYCPGQVTVCRGECAVLRRPTLSAGDLAMTCPRPRAAISEIATRRIGASRFASNDQGR